MEAAESLCARDGIESFEVLDLLQNLATKSLIGVDEGVAGRVRYRMLDTIRQYASEKLIHSDQARTFRDRHLDWFLDLAEEAGPKLCNGEQVVMLNRLDAEHDNFRAALAWSMETAVEKGLRLAADLWRFWVLRGYWFELHDWLKKLLAQPEALAPASTRAYALATYGHLESNQGENADAEKSYAEGLQIYRQLGDEKGIAYALSELARLSIQQGDYSRARELSQESLEIYRQTGNEFQICQALNRLAEAHRAQGEWTMANALLKESGTRLWKTVDTGSIQDLFTSTSLDEARFVYFSLAVSEVHQGNLERAHKFLENGLAFFRQTGSSHEIAWFLRYLADLAWRERDLIRAQTLYQESLQIVQDLKDKQCTANTLDGLARVENGKGNYDHATSLARQALNFHEQIGNKQGFAQDQWVLGLALLHTDPSGAEQMLKSSLTTRNKLRLKDEIAESFEALAKMNSLGGAFERATKLFAVACVLRENIPFALTPAEHAELDRDLNVLRAELGDEAFNAAWAEGQKMTLEQAVEYALKEVAND